MNTFKTLQIRAVSRYVKVSPNKIRRVLRQIKGINCYDALLLLQFLPYSACEPVIKVLYSSIANAKNKFGLNKSKLFIKEIFANQSKSLKKIRVRAKNRVNKIVKIMSSITIVVEEKKNNKNF